MNKKPSNELRNLVKNLNIEIRHHFQSLKTQSLRRKITPGNSKSLWDAVKLAKNINIQQMPQQMFKNNVPINDENLPDEFAEFFKLKVQNIVTEQTINNSVFNGTQKINSIEVGAFLGIINQNRFPIECCIIKFMKTITGNYVNSSYIYLSGNNLTRFEAGVFQPVMQKIISKGGGYPNGYVWMNLSQFFNQSFAHNF